MAEIPKIVLPHGGYKKLIVYRKSDVVYEGTVMFCRRFLPIRGDRTVDQMTQDYPPSRRRVAKRCPSRGARSCKQNIAEGSSASGTSKETELKLTNVARATLDELMGKSQSVVGLSRGVRAAQADAKSAKFAKERKDGRAGAPRTPRWQKTGFTGLRGG